MWIKDPRERNQIASISAVPTNGGKKQNARVEQTKQRSHRVVVSYPGARTNTGIKLYYDIVLSFFPPSTPWLFPKVRRERDDNTGIKNPPYAVDLYYVQ